MIWSLSPQGLISNSKDGRSRGSFSRKERDTTWLLARIDSDSSILRKLDIGKKVTTKKLPSKLKASESALFPLARRVKGLQKGRRVQVRPF